MVRSAGNLHFRDAASGMNGVVGVACNHSEIQRRKGGASGRDHRRRLARGVLRSRLCGGLGGCLRSRVGLWGFSLCCYCGSRGGGLGGRSRGIELRGIFRAGGFGISGLVGAEPEIAILGEYNSEGNQQKKERNLKLERLPVG